MDLLPVLKGATRRLRRAFRSPPAHAAGGNDTARYCYAVWLRHLIAARATVQPSGPIQRVAELGPGLSLGTAVTARLTGVRQYLALDAFRDASASNSEEILGEVAELLNRRAPIPDHAEFPEIWPRLKSYDLPDWVEVRADDSTVRLVRDELTRALDPESSLPARGTGIRYVAPWSGSLGADAPRELDLVFSQAVFEHVDDVPGVYRELGTWLRAGGASSHTIDFRSHDFTAAWYGHWEYPAILWRIVESGGVNHLNRLALSHHVEATEAAGLAVVNVDQRRAEAGVAPQRLVRAGVIRAGDESAQCAHVIARRAGTSHG